MAHCALGRQSRDAFSFESFFISPNVINHIKMNILCFSIDKGRPPMDRAVSYTEVYSSSSFLLLIKRFHKTKIKLKCGNSMKHSLLMCVFFRFRCRTSLPISTHNMPDTRYLTNTRPNVDHERKYPKMAVINKLCIRTRQLYKFRPYSQSK